MNVSDSTPRVAHAYVLNPARVMTPRLRTVCRGWDSGERIIKVTHSHVWSVVCVCLSP